MSHSFRESFNYWNQIELIMEIMNQNGKGWILKFHTSCSAQLSISKNQVARVWTYQTVLECSMKSFLPYHHRQSHLKEKSMKSNRKTFILRNLSIIKNRYCNLKKQSEMLQTNEIDTSINVEIFRNNLH